MRAVPADGQLGDQADLAAVAAVHRLLGADAGDVAARAEQGQRRVAGLRVAGVRALEQALDVGAVARRVREDRAGLVERHLRRGGRAGAGGAAAATGARAAAAGGEADAAADAAGAGAGADGDAGGAAGSGAGAAQAAAPASASTAERRASIRPGIGR